MLLSCCFRGRDSSGLRYDVADDAQPPPPPAPILEKRETSQRSISAAHKSLDCAVSSSSLIIPAAPANSQAQRQPNCDTPTQAGDDQSEQQFDDAQVVAVVRWHQDTSGSEAATVGHPASSSAGSSSQDVLLRVSSLMQRMVGHQDANGTLQSSLQSALNIVAQDCQAAYISVGVLSEDASFCMEVTSVGLPDKLQGVRHPQSTANSLTAMHSLARAKQSFISWDAGTATPPPPDWQMLHQDAGLRYFSASPIKAGNKRLGILTFGFTASRDDCSMWPTYCQLVATMLSTLLKDTALLKAVNVLRQLQHIFTLDLLAHHCIKELKAAVGQSENQHLWFRIGLLSSSRSTATILDDLTPGPKQDKAHVHRTHSFSSAPVRQHGPSSANPCITRKGVDLKTTILRVMLNTHKQMVIQDMQQLVNQSGRAATDIFHTGLMAPPTSALVVPLRHHRNIFGAVYAMSAVKTNFADISGPLQQICHTIGPSILYLLSSACAADYQDILALSAPAGGELPTPPASVLSINSTLGRSSAPLGRSGPSVTSLQASSATSLMSTRRSISFTRRSSTGALVMGLMEKLNQKRVQNAVLTTYAATQQEDVLAQLELSNKLGQGGYARVFRGLWQGLEVAVKVMSDGQDNHRLVMRNAHEMAILSALSHPNILQAYTCVSDVSLAKLEQQCARSCTEALVGTAGAPSSPTLDSKALCHLQVVELCDLGSMASALKAGLFFPKARGSGLWCNGAGSYGLMPAERRVEYLDMPALLTTLIEVASAGAYMHRMGVVHCDLKPANILVCSSTRSARGFTVKIADFGLSRVEDDDDYGLFPCNSCGTTAYVAPEALGRLHKVDSSVDVYAFGILMWELMVARMPYGSLSPEAIADQVAHYDLRPTFPRNAPAAYVGLATACWQAQPSARPSFESILGCLQRML